MLFKSINIGGSGTVIKGLKKGAAISVTPLKREKVLLQYGLKVGSGNKFSDDGSGISWRFAVVEKPSAYFERLNVPPDCGSCLVVDLRVKPTAVESDIKKTANFVKRFLSHHFSNDLSASSQFKGLFVFPTVDDGDGSRVVRIALCYKRIASIDMFFEHMHIDCGKLFSVRIL
jgi:hypothetical protein